MQATEEEEGASQTQEDNEGEKERGRKGDGKNGKGKQRTAASSSVQGTAAQAFNVTVPSKLQFTAMFLQVLEAQRLFLAPDSVNIAMVL